MLYIDVSGAIQVNKSSSCGQVFRVNSTDELLSNTQLNGGGNANVVNASLQMIDDQFDSKSVMEVIKGRTFLPLCQKNFLILLP